MWTDTIYVHVSLDHFLCLGEILIRKYADSITNLAHLQQMKFKGSGEQTGSNEI